jgi:hypothetical protein
VKRIWNDTADPLHLLHPWETKLEQQQQQQLRSARDGDHI